MPWTEEGTVVYGNQWTADRVLDEIEQETRPALQAALQPNAVTVVDGGGHLHGPLYDATGKIHKQVYGIDMLTVAERALGKGTDLYRAYCRVHLGERGQFANCRRRFARRAGGVLRGDFLHQATG